MKPSVRVTVLCLAGLVAACGAGEDAPADYPVVDDSFLAAANWRFVGPYRGGRVLAVAGDVRDPLVHYFGAAHGGVWKTTDAGLNWRNVSDDYFEFPAVGALVLKLGLTGVLVLGLFYRFPVGPISFAIGASLLPLAAVLDATLLGTPLPAADQSVDGNG